MIDSWDLAIIGGGASGLMAGGLAARQGLRTVVLEKQPRVGRKLLATGNGTCNITNQHAAPAHYHGADAAFVAAVLDRFSPEEACRYFASIGLECIVRPDGRAYPAANRQRPCWTACGWSWLLQAQWSGPMPRWKRYGPAAAGLPCSWRREPCKPGVC